MMIADARCAEKAEPRFSHLAECIARKQSAENPAITKNRLAFSPFRQRLE